MCNTLTTISDYRRTGGGPIDPLTSLPRHLLPRAGANVVTPRRTCQRIGSAHLRELIDTRQDIPALREQFFKPTSKLARDIGYDVLSEDLLPLTPGNDPLYLQENHVEKGRWFGTRFDALDPDEPIHPRGMHYKLRGTGTLIPTADGDEEYDPSHWDRLQNSAKYAQLIGVVDPQRMKDEKNHPPDGLVSTRRSGEYHVEEPIVSEDREPARDLELYPWDWPNYGYTTPTPRPIRPVDEATFDQSDEKLNRFIDSHIDRIVEESFGEVRYKAANHQDWYVEVWCEKSNIIPDGIRVHENVSERLAGGGEFSFQMCYRAVQQAKQRGQNLAVVLLSDYDPKGADMAKSISRKVEAEAALSESAAGSFGSPIEAVVTHAALTPEQVERFDLPATPIESDHAGYSGQAVLFEDLAVEINALAEIHPDELRTTTENAIAPFVDSELQSRLNDARQRAEDRFREELKVLYTEAKPGLRDRQEAIPEAFDEYNEELADEREALNEKIREVNKAIHEYRELEGEVRDGTIGSIVDDLENATRSVEYSKVLDNVEVDLPGANVPGPHGLAEPPILDTRRTMGEQLDVYRHYDYRID